MCFVNCLINVYEIIYSLITQNHVRRIVYKSSRCIMLNRRVIASRRISFRDSGCKHDLFNVLRVHNGSPDYL